MLSHAIARRALWLAACVSVLGIGPVLADGGPTSPRPAQVALEHKAQHVPGAQLAVYEDELIDCSALAAIHTWLGNPLEEDEGFEVRQTLARDYWIEISNEYLALARQATGDADVQKKVGARMRVLASEWRRLTESQSVAVNWNGWYELIDRCDSWRPDKPAHAFYSKGRKAEAEQGAKTKVAIAAQ